MVKSYIITVIIMSMITTIVLTLGKTRTSGGEKVLKFVCSIIMLIVFIAPIARFDFEALAQSARDEILSVSGKNSDYNSAYREILREQSATALSDYTDEELRTKLKLAAGAAKSEFTLAENVSGELYITNIKVTLTSLSAVAKRDAVNAYLLAVFGSAVNIEFAEAFG